MNRVRLFYLQVQGAFGIYLPFINVYFAHDRGLSGQEIGILAGVAPLMTLVVAPLWGAAADRRGSRIAVLRWSVAGTAAAILLVGSAESFWLLLPAMGIFALFQVAIIPLSDGAVSAAAANQKISYGSLRLWGSIGFMIGGPLMGLLANRFGLRAIFPLYALLMLLALPVLWHMIPCEPPSSSSTRRGTAFSLLRHRSILLFLIIAGLAAIGISAGYQFLSVFLHSLGASPGLIGAVSALGAFFEVPGMLWSGRLIHKYGAPTVFAAGIGLFLAGWALYAGLQSPGHAWAVQVLLGAGMGLLWPAAVTNLAQQVPSERAATAQALISAVMYGLAPLLAAQLAGLIYDDSGARAVLILAAGMMGTGLLLFGITRRWLGIQPQGLGGDE
jgi:PPP family 3-phenylpropionic acid transporter